MPRVVAEEIPDRMAFTFTPINRSAVQDSMKKKEFLSVSSLINTALRFYFENRDKSSSKDDFKSWLSSKEGENYMKDIFRMVRDE